MKYLTAFFLFLFIFPLQIAAENPPISIGATLALTGKFAFIGESERDGLLMAVEEINRAGGVEGRKIRLVIEDNQGQPKVAVNSVHRFLQVDNPLVVFSAFTHITQSIKDIVAKSEALLFYASSVKLMANSSPWIFRDYLDVEEAGRSLAKLAVSRNYKEIVLFRDEGDVCTQFEAAFNEVAEKNEVRVARRFEYTSGEGDLRTLVLTATTPEPEAIIFCAWRDTQLVMTQLMKLKKLNIPTLHAVGPFLPVSDTKKMRALYEENGTVSTWFGFTEATELKLQKDFIGKFKTRFKRKPRPDAAYAYDDVYALKAALEPCVRRGAVNRICLAEELQKVQYAGVAGSLKFDSDGSSTRQNLLIRVRDGVWEEFRE